MVKIRYLSVGDSDIIADRIGMSARVCYLIYYGGKQSVAALVVKKKKNAVLVWMYLCNDLFVLTYDTNESIV